MISSMIEIERKFMPVDPHHKHAVWAALACADSLALITQGYLNAESKTTTRVRVYSTPTDSHAELTLKIKQGKQKGKLEINKPLTEEEALAILLACGTATVVKNRYTVSLSEILAREAIPHNAELYKDVKLEIDIFRGPHQGLIYVEVEKPESLPHSDFDNLVLPSWCSNEVTNRKGYSNKALAVSQALPPHHGN